MSDQGFGTTVTFASGFFAEIREVNWDGIERDDLEATHMESVDGWMEFDPSDLKNPGELSVELFFDPDQEPPIDQPKEDITVTFPLPAGKATAATWKCEGYLKSMSAAVPMDDKMTASAVIKFSGKPTFTPSAEA